MNIRLLAELASAKKGEEPTERRTGVYTRVHEDSSTGATKSFEAEVGLCKKSILAFDTSSETCSVAIRTLTQCFEKINTEPRKQAERLLPMIDDLLMQAGLSRSDLNGLALTHGPGAFTGVRIAIAAAQGIAYALDLPVVTVSSLAALAQGAHRKFGWRQVLSAFDARMSEVYWGGYQLDSNGLMVNVIPDGVTKPEQVYVLDEPRTGWYGAGSAWPVYSDRFPAVNAFHSLSIDAFDILALALPFFQSGQTLTADKINPVYLRNNVVKSHQIGAQGES